jgi:hypothetical protein
VKRPTRVPSQLSESLHKQLNAYTFAASAAGVGILALTLPAEGKIVYTPAHVKIGYEGANPYFLDINHDGVADFMFSSHFGLDAPGLDVCPALRSDQQYCSWGTGEFSNQIRGYQPNGPWGWASALLNGARIAPNRKHFVKYNFQMATMRCGSSTCKPPRGPWANESHKSRYLGFKFAIGGSIHYGWARLRVRVDRKNATFRATLTGYAYETIPNKSITAGQTHGNDDATLGRLAQGASGFFNRGNP